MENKGITPIKTREITYKLEASDAMYCFNIIKSSY